MWREFATGRIFLRSLMGVKPALIGQFTPRHRTLCLKDCVRNGRGNWTAMANEPGTRISRFASRLEEIEHALIVIGIDPTDPEAAREFARNYRQLCDLLERRERRSKWLIGVVTTLVGGVVTALAVSQGPALLTALARGLVGK
jgi:hypothetical protein